MGYHLDFTENAQKELTFHKKSGNKVILKKILKLLEELSEHPFDGTGKPELLKHELSGLWSRRINREHRLVYQVNNKTIIILSAKGHYF